jgi:hypothetical protein
MPERTVPRFWTRACFGLDFALDRSSTNGGLLDPGSSTSVRVAASTRATRQFEGWQWTPIFFSSESGPQGTPTVIIDNLPGFPWVRMRYDDGATFVINRDGSAIYASWASDATLEDAETYLVGPVIGLLLYLRGLTCLHASAIAHQGKALIFVGPAEAGKSTLAAAFARSNLGVLSDDILVLDRASDHFVARPGIPRIGLWPASVENLWGDQDALPRQVATWDKRYLDLDHLNLFQQTPLPVGAVYILGDRMPGERPRIEPLQGTGALLALIANKYVTRISEREQDRRDFVLLSELGASVPVRRITRSDALSDLDETCGAILADYAALALAPA